MIKRFLNWYWFNVKYRNYTRKQRKYLCRFEQGIRARREIEHELYVILRLNIVRAKHLFDNKFEDVKVVENEIVELGAEWDKWQKAMDAFDSMLWRKVFFHFIETHDNLTVADVWGTPLETILKFRKSFLSSLNEVEIANLEK